MFELNRPDWWLVSPLTDVSDIWNNHHKQTNNTRLGTPKYYTTMDQSANCRTSTSYFLYWQPHAKAPSPSWIACIPALPALPVYKLLMVRSDLRMCFYSKSNQKESPSEISMCTVQWCGCWTTGHGEEMVHELVITELKMFFLCYCRLVNVYQRAGPEYHQLVTK